LAERRAVFGLPAANLPGKPAAEANWKEEFVMRRLMGAVVISAGAALMGSGCSSPPPVVNVTTAPAATTTSAPAARVPVAAAPRPTERTKTVTVPAPAPRVVVVPADPYQSAYDAFNFHPGRVCREMSDRGWSYTAMYAWYASHGYPNHMDADGNGIPCETVYG
jgi:Excalibur calcium-binding domain